MMARQRELAGEREHIVGDVGGVHHFEIGQRQRAGLVEDDPVDLGQPLDGIAGIEQHAGLEHRAGGDGLHGRDRETQRAGAGDDENRDAGDDGVMPARARQHPAEHGQERGGVHHRRIEPRRPVRKPHIARARLQRIVEQPGDLRQQRAFGRRGNPHPQCAGDVERARIDRRALLRRDVQGLAGDQALVDLGTPLDHRAVDRATLARPQQHDVAGTDRRDRHLRDFVGADELGRGLRLQRREISGDRAGPPPHALVEVAPDQQKRQQHDRRVEIGMLGMIDGFDHRHARARG